MASTACDGRNEIEAPPVNPRGTGAVDATWAFMISVSRPASAAEDWTRLFDLFVSCNLAANGFP